MVDMVDRLEDRIMAEDTVTEVPIEDIIDLIAMGETAEILFQENPNPIPNVITIICDGRYSVDIREIKPVITTHSPTQILIRSHNKNKIITSWREFYVHSAKVYFSLKIDHLSNQVQVEQKVDECQAYVSS